MIRKILAVTCISLALLIPQNVKAAETTNNFVVDEYKNWTIHFNREVAFDDLSKQGIVVTDSKGNKVDVQLELGKDNKSIIVEYPTWGYLLGEKYQLTVNNKVHDKNNKSIKQATFVNFSVEPENKDAVIFKDKVFQDSVKNYLKKPNEEILKSDVDKLTEFDAGGIDVEDISGIDEFVNLEDLNLSNTKVKDISSLKELTSLEELTLENTNISDITPLKNLYNLEVLDLSNTKVSDISALKGLKNLEELYLVNSPIKDLSVLKELDNLEALNLDNTQISDISALKQLKNLKELIVNGLSDSEQKILENALPNCRILGL